MWTITAFDGGEIGMMLVSYYDGGVWLIGNTDGVRFFISAVPSFEITMPVTRAALDAIRLGGPS